MVFKLSFGSYFKIQIAIIVHKIRNSYNNFRQEKSDPESETTLEYRVEGLRPATAYALRIVAINDIGDSDYSKPVIIQTLEEGQFYISLVY